MRNRELNRQLQELKALIKKTNDASAGSIEIQAHWARYICVLASGFIENSLKEVYSEFVKNASSKPVSDFSCSVLSKIQNPKTNKFIEIARKFKVIWADQLEEYVANDGRKEAIDSIMSNRHLIAHGKNTSITIVRIKVYIEKSVEVIEFIEGQCRA